MSAFRQQAKFQLHLNFEPCDSRILDMKQRITYLLPEGTRVDAKSIEVGNDSLKFTRASEAAEEWRLTLGWDELTQEVCLSHLMGHARPTNTI